MGNYGLASRERRVDRAFLLEGRSNLVDPPRTLTTHIHVVENQPRLIVPPLLYYNAYIYFFNVTLSSYRMSCVAYLLDYY